MCCRRRRVSFISIRYQTWNIQIWFFEFSVTLARRHCWLHTPRINSSKNMSLQCLKISMPISWSMAFRMFYNSGTRPGKKTTTDSGLYLTPWRTYSFFASHSRDSTPCITSKVNGCQKLNTTARKLQFCWWEPNPTWKMVQKTRLPKIHPSTPKWVNL